MLPTMSLATRPNQPTIASRDKSPRVHCRIFQRCAGVAEHATGAKSDDLAPQSFGAGHHMQGVWHA